MGRRNKPISRRPTFAIVVDGETEVWYFNMLIRNERGLKIAIKPELPKKKSISEQYNTVKALAEDYTKVFWIVDLDVVIREDIENKKSKNQGIHEFNRLKLKLAKECNNVVTIVNNPCTEFWFLLHFVYTLKKFNSCGDAEKDLKKHLKGYEKTKDYFTKVDNDIYLKLKPFLLKGIGNSKKTGIFNVGEFENSISEFYKFFEDESFKDYFNVK